MNETQQLEQREAGRGLDAEIAERVMGYSWYSFEDSSVFTYLVKWMNTDRETMVGRRRDGALDSYTGRDYSTEVAAAFQVVEAMLADGWRIYIDGPRFGDTEWRVMFAKDRLNEWALADTLPLAICLASLAALDASTPPSAVEDPTPVAALSEGEGR